MHFPLGKNPMMINLQFWKATKLCQQCFSQKHLEEINPQEGIQYHWTISSYRDQFCQNPNKTMPTSMENKTIAPQWKCALIYCAISNKGGTKECSDYRTITIILISHASNVMNEVLPTTTFMVWEISNVQEGF